MNLVGKKILLGISGGIAAYKCAELTRRLKDQGALVQVVMTQAAQAFITPLTMQAVSGKPVSVDLLDPSAEASMGHIELAKWADLILLAPATADLIARMAAGMGNDLLTTLVLASPAPIAVSPAMNQQMYSNSITQENIAKLAKHGMHIWGPDEGAQACGDVGAGRMLSPDALVEHCVQFFAAPKLPLKGKHLLITAGPTQEAIDPVRYLSNHSSGKMGYALAQAACELGATVSLVSGPVALTAPSKAQLISVTSAVEMHQAVMANVKDCDIFIGCAAVADYRVAQVADKKIKKDQDGNGICLELIENPDILASVGHLTEHRPFTVGFAAETHDVEAFAKQKLKKKRADLICANNVAIEGQGFGADNNAFTLYWQEGSHALALNSKATLAHSIISLIAHLID